MASQLPQMPSGATPGLQDYIVRSDLGGHIAHGDGQALLSLVHISDAHVMDSASPARCEWVELRGQEALWQPLLHTHRPYEALTHFALAAHIDALGANPLAPASGQAYDLALFTGDNIDNAQANELEAFIALVGGGQASLSAYGGVHDIEGAQDWLAAQPDGLWPYWCPQAAVPCAGKALGLPAMEDFLARASAVIHSRGLGFAWTSVAGNHDVLRQGTALSNSALEAIATGRRKTLAQPPGFAPADPFSAFLDQPEAFSKTTQGPGTRTIVPDAGRRIISAQAFADAHAAAGAKGYAQLAPGQRDTYVDTEHVRIILLDTNHPWGDYQGSLGKRQLAWLDDCLREVGRTPGRHALIASHHGCASLVNQRGHDPERVHAQALTDVLHRHACVLAWLVGHRHIHRIDAHPPRVQARAGGGRGFWEIATASLIDWPSQARAIELLRHSDGSLELVCTPLDHRSPAGSMAALHHGLAQSVAGVQAQAMQGRAQDGRVRLVFPI